MSKPLPLKRIIEGALFAASEPLTVGKLVSLFDKDKQAAVCHHKVRQVLEILQQDYIGHGVELKELANGWQFQVCQDLAPWIGRLWLGRLPRYSRALMETLALIAYKQPITRAEIEQVRGVTVNSAIIRTLEEHGWIKAVGRKEVPGRPELLATTKQFLSHFGLKRLDELPLLAMQSAIDPKEDLQRSLPFEKVSQDDSNSQQQSDAQEEGWPVQHPDAPQK